MDLALEAGAEDVQQRGRQLRRHLRPERVHRVCATPSRKPASRPKFSHITRIPKDTVDLDASTAQTVLKLMEALDDHDDVQNVAANFNIPDEAMAAIESPAS